MVQIHSTIFKMVTLVYPWLVPFILFLLLLVFCEPQSSNCWELLICKYMEKNLHCPMVLIDGGNFRSMDVCVVLSGEEQSCSLACIQLSKQENFILTGLYSVQVRCCLELLRLTYPKEKTKCEASDASLGSFERLEERIEKRGRRISIISWSS